VQLSNIQIVVVINHVVMPLCSPGWLSSTRLGRDIARLRADKTHGVDALGVDVDRTSP